MKTRINALRALYHAWRATRLGQKSITHARKAAQLTPAETGVEGLALWFGYWSAWSSLADAQLGPMKALMALTAAAKAQPKEQHVHTPEGEVRVLDWTETEGSRELLKSGFPAPSNETKN